ncbi:MAG: cytochrome c peroxidase [Pseudomonadota bacterium]
MRLSLGLLALSFISAADAETGGESWSQGDIRFLEQFSLSSLPTTTANRGNDWAYNDGAAKLGHQIFFDPGFSANRAVSCASCHRPSQYFTDARAVALGLGLGSRNTPSILLSGRSPWNYWDGRKDSLWAQALAPLENPNEHGFSRERVAQIIGDRYAESYQAVFGRIDPSAPNHHTEIFVNVGKALMAYQNKLRILPSKFDRFVDSHVNQEQQDKTELSVSESRGLRLFMGKAACVGCHNGPLFSNFEFHNVGVPEANVRSVDLGRYNGIELLRADEFNCLSRWSDADRGECEEMQFLKQQGAELVGAFKTPSLRNVAKTAPYMHSGQFTDLLTVLRHYNTPTPPFFDSKQHPSRPHFDILPLGLNDEELADIIAFLGTLTSPLPENDPWWVAPSAKNSR